MKRNNKIKPELASFLLAASLLNSTAFAGFLPISVEKINNVSNQNDAEKILGEIEAKEQARLSNYNQINYVVSDAGMAIETVPMYAGPEWIQQTPKYAGPEIIQQMPKYAGPEIIQQMPKYAGPIETIIPTIVRYAGPESDITKPQLQVRYAGPEMDIIQTMVRYAGPEINTQLDSQINNLITRYAGPDRPVLEQIMPRYAGPETFEINYIMARYAGPAKF